MLVYGLSTGNKIGLAATAAAFIAFALTSSFLFPRLRSSFPGRGLPAFVIVCFLFFFGMLAAVEVFGAEKTEGTEQAAGSEPSTSAPTTAPSSTTTVQLTTTEAPTTTKAPATTKTPEPASVTVKESEFKIELPSKTLKPGEVTFEVENEGKIPHNLVVTGNGSNAQTPIFPGGTKKELKVTLKPGNYELICSVPGHKQAGMDQKITVTG